MTLLTQEGDDMAKAAIHGSMATGPEAGTQADLDRPSAIAAASYFTSLTMLAINVQPLVLGALAVGYGLTDRDLGQISAVFIGSTTLATLTAPLWVRRVDWRLFSLITLVLCSAVFAFGATSSTGTHFLLLFTVLGLVKGCVGTPAFASLGDASNPERAYSVSIIWQNVVAALVTIPLSSFVIPRYGAGGMFLALAAIFLTGVFACRWLPRRGRDVEVTPGASQAAPIFSRHAVAPLVGLLALGLFTAGVLGFWYFVERIGAGRGHSTGFIGIVLSLGALATILSAGLAAWLGGRAPSRVAVLGGSFMLLIGFALLRIPGEFAYAASAFLFSLGWGLAQPSYWAIVRKIDATSRLFVASAAAQGASGVVIGLVAGPIIERGGYDLLMIFSGGLVAAGAVCLGVAGVIGAARLQRV